MSCTLTENVDLELSTDGDEREGGGAILVEAEDGGHGIRVTEEETYVEFGVGCLHEQKWMNT